MNREIIFPADPSGDLIRSEYGEIVHRYFIGRGEDRNIAVDPNTFTLSLGDTVIALLPHYECFLNSSAEEHDAAMDRLFQATRPLTRIEFTSASLQLMPVFRTAFQESNVRLALRVGEVAADVGYSMPWQGHLRLAFVIDQPMSRRPIDRDDVERASLTSSTLLEQAIANVRKLGTFDLVEISPGVFEADNPDGYDAARLFLAKSLDLSRLGQDPIAMVPNTNRLLIASSRDTLMKLIELGEQYLLDDGSPLSPDLLILREGTWTLLEMKNGMAEKHRYNTTIARWFAAVYATQATLLKKIYPDAEVDPYVASFKVALDRDGTATSYTTVTEGVTVPFLLPTADQIVFVPEQGAPQRVAWETVQKQWYTFERSDISLEPPRWMVEGFPSPAQLMAMAENR